MIAAPAESHEWSHRRLWITVAALVMLQFGLICWLGERSEPALPPVAPRLRLVLPGRPVEELTLVNDPTLFVRPNPHGFSGEAWMNIPTVNYPARALDWSDPERLLEPQVDQLGAGLLRFVQTNTLGDSQMGRHPEPQLEHTEFYPMLNLSSTQSTVRVEGDLSRRRLETEFVLKSWAPTNQIVLRNSEVLVGVMPDGRVLSAVPLAQQSELKEADDEALSLARSARFAALPAAESNRTVPPGPTLTWGRLIFQWQTIAPPPTNTPAGGP